MGRPTSLELEVSELFWNDYDGNPYNLIDETHRVEIIESIDSHFMHGFIEFNDLNGITEFRNGYSGGYLKIKFRTNEAFPYITKEFWVYGVGDDQQKGANEQYNNRDVKMFFASRSLELELFEKYSKVFKDKKAHEIVQDVCKNMLGIESLNQVDNTKEKLKLVVPYWSAIDIINWCRKKSFSESNQDTGYIFYEDNTGFNYVSLSEIMKQGSKYKLNMKPTSDKNLRESEFHYVGKIERYKVKKHVDLISSWTNHRFGGSIHFFNLDGKKFEERKHVFDEGYLSKTVNLGNKTVTHNSIKNEKAFHIPFYGSLPDYKLSPYSRFNLLDDNMLEVFTPGDSNRKCGEILKIDFPSKDKGKVNNVSLEGTYLIRSIHHELHINKKKYVQKMLLVKDALKQTSLSTFNTGKKNP